MLFSSPYLVKKVKGLVSSRWIVLIILFILTPIPSVNSEYTLVNQETVASTSLSQTEYLIITSDAFVDYVQSLAKWKTQRGLFAAIQTVEDIESQYIGVDLSEKIKNCIRDYHENQGTTWVVLAGGVNIVPTRTVYTNGAYVSCDYYYANLDNNWDILSSGVATIVDANDWEVEVYIGRLPADNSTQMEDLVSRLIEYERNPPIGEWMKTAVFDYIGFDTNRNHNWLAENIIPSDWNCILLGETEGIQTTKYSYDYSINESILVECVNAGASIVMSDAHGSPTSTQRSIFVNDVDGDGLFDSGTDDIDGSVFLSTSTPFDVGNKLGFYFLAACSTGTFVGYDCLTEYITRTSGIGCIGSSASAYYDSNWYDGETLGWYTQGLSERFWRRIFSEDGNHPGKALALAKENYSEDYVLLNPDAYDGGRTLSQFNLMGDPEVPLWLDIPLSLNISANANNVTRAISVLAEVDNSPISDVVVTMVGESIYQRAVTDFNGEVLLSMPNAESLSEVTITVSKNGYTPSEAEVLIPPAEFGINILSIETAAITAVTVAIVLVVVIMRKRGT
jgi:hypothetical protein